MTRTVPIAAPAPGHGAKEHVRDDRAGTAASGPGIVLSREQVYRLVTGTPSGSISPRSPLVRHPGCHSR